MVPSCKNDKIHWTGVQVRILTIESFFSLYLCSNLVFLLSHIHTLPFPFVFVSLPFALSKTLHDNHLEVDSPSSHFPPSFCSPRVMFPIVSPLAMLVIDGAGELWCWAPK